MDITKAFDICIRILKIPFTLYGFTVSLWQCILFFVVAGILILLIGGLLK